MYSDAPAVGGAEISAGNLLAELDRAIEVTVVGVDAEVVDAIASRRPGTIVREVPRVRNKGDLPAIAAHVRALRSLRPDALQVNRQNSWAGQYGLLAGIITSTPVIAVEHAVFRSTSALQRRLRRALFSEWRLTLPWGAGRRAMRRRRSACGGDPSR